MAANSSSVIGVEMAIGCKSDAITGYAVDTSGNLSSIQEIDMRGYRGGEIVRRSGSTSTVTVYSSPTQTGTFGPKDDASGNALTLTIGASDEPAELPAAVFGSNWLKLVGDASGSFDIGLKG